MIKFEVTFLTRTQYGLIALPSKDGVEALKFARDLSNGKFVDYEKVPLFHGANITNLILEIPIDQAIDIPHFADKSYVYVTVQHMSFNKYTKVLFHENEFLVDIHKGKILEDWVSAGYPTNWEL